MVPVPVFDHIEKGMILSEMYQTADMEDCISGGFVNVLALEALGMILLYIAYYTMLFHQAYGS